MSRCYRIRQTVRVQDALHRDVRASDEICTELEMLEILPPADMGALLRQELLRRGFEDRDGTMVRTQDDMEIRVNPENGEVSIRIAKEETIEAGGAKESEVFGEATEAQRAQLRERLRKELEDRLDQQAGELQRRISGAMEAQLGDISAELDQVVNRVTAEALKQKAAQLGQIKEITEDAENGSLTIKVEV